MLWINYAKADPPEIFVEKSTPAWKKYTNAVVVAVVTIIRYAGNMMLSPGFFSIIHKADNP